MKRNPRYLLLPLWIRFFSWIFLIVGACIPLIGLLAAFSDGSGTISLFGFEYKGSMWHPMPLAMTACFLFFGYTGFALLWGRKEGRWLGLASGYFGIAIVITAFFAGLKNGGLTISFEPIFQVPFLIVLHRRRGRWEEEPNQTLQPTAATGRG